MVRTMNEKCYAAVDGCHTLLEAREVIEDCRLWLRD